MQFSADGRYLATASFDNQACVWDRRTGRAVAQFGHPDWVFPARFGPAGARLLTACRDGMGRLWDWQAGRLVCPAFEHDYEIHTVAFTPDGRQILTAGDDRTLRLWEPTTGKPVAPPLSLAGPGLAITVTPDGKHAILSGSMNTLARFPLADLLAPGRAGRGRSLHLERGPFGPSSVHKGGGVTNLTAEEWLQRWQTLGPRKTGRLQPATIDH